MATMTLKQLAARIADIIAENPARADLPVIIRAKQTRPDNRKRGGVKRRDLFAQLEYAAQCPITFSSGAGDVFAELSAGDLYHVGAWR